MNHLLACVLLPVATYAKLWPVVCVDAIEFDDAPEFVVIHLESEDVLLHSATNNTTISFITSKALFEMIFDIDFCAASLCCSTILLAERLLFWSGMVHSPHLWLSYDLCHTFLILYWFCVFRVANRMNS